MDVPPAICQTVDVSRLDAAELRARGAAGWARRDETIHFRLGNDLLAFPAAYLLVAADPGSFGCVRPAKKIEFAFWASDMAPPDRPMFWEPMLEAAEIAPSRPPDDFIVKVMAFYYNDHPDWADMGKRLAGIRSARPSRGTMHGLEDFSSQDIRYLVWISEDRGVLVRASLAAVPNPVAEMSFQNARWFARALVPLAAVARWDFIYGRIDAFAARHTVKDYFRK